MGIMVYSLLWVVQDFVHQPYHPKNQAVNKLVVVILARGARRRDDESPRGSEATASAGTPAGSAQLSKA